MQCKAQNAVNPNGLTSILTQQCGKFVLKKRVRIILACLIRNSCHVPALILRKTNIHRKKHYTLFMILKCGCNFDFRKPRVKSKIYLPFPFNSRHLKPFDSCKIETVCRFTSFMLHLNKAMLIYGNRVKMIKNR